MVAEEPNTRNAVGTTHTPPPEQDTNEPMQIDDEEDGGIAAQHTTNVLDDSADSGLGDGDAVQNNFDHEEEPAEEHLMNAALELFRRSQEIVQQPGYREPTEDERFAADVAYFDRLIQEGQDAEDVIGSSEEAAPTLMQHNGHQQPVEEVAHPRVYPPQRRRQHAERDGDSDDDVQFLGITQRHPQPQGEDVQIVDIVPRRRRGYRPEVARAEARLQGVELRDFKPLAYAGRPAPKEGECVCCLVDDATVAVVGCGHLVACGPCAIEVQKNRKCPVCCFIPKNNEPLHMILIFTGREKPPPQQQGTK